MNLEPNSTPWLEWVGVVVACPSALPSSAVLAKGQNARFALEAVTLNYTPPIPSGAVGHNPLGGSGQFLGRTLLKMHFPRVGVKIKIGHTTRVDVCVLWT